MLEALVGSTAAERVLLFLSVRGSGYAREIADLYGTGPSQVQRVLDRMERDGMLVSRTVGRTRVYEFSPRFPLRDNVRALFREALNYYPDDLQSQLSFSRKRPRRKGKPL
jgi:DNA-binding MarR family transcriptional regulator